MQEYWRDVDAYRASKVDADKMVYFLDGPPNTSGKTHLGTIWNKVLKDAVIRTARLSGYRIVDQPGYDTHLFSTEQRIADTNDISSTDDIRKFGVRSFEQRCESFEERNIEELESDFRDFGVWMDWENHYRTDSPSYADTAWWAFKQLYESESLAEREQVCYRCPQCELTLRKRSEMESDHLPYQNPPDAEKTPAYFTYPLEDKNGAVVVRAEESWHVLFNTFLTVNPDEQYATVNTDEHGYVYLASDRVDDVLPREVRASAEIEAYVSGERFVTESYRHPLLEPSHVTAASDEQSFQIIARKQPDETTGFGHGVPGCDERSRQEAVKNDIAIHTPLRSDGTLDSTVDEFAEEAVRSDDERLDALITDSLDQSGHFIRYGDASKRTRQCWLCGGAVVPTLSRQWYVQLTHRDDELYRAISSVEWAPDDVKETMRSPDAWHPDWSRDTRFERDSDANKDWLIEQDAYWGLPIPVWVAADDPTDRIVLGSRSEIAERADQSIAVDDVKPRRSILDEITITENGTEYRRIEGTFADRYSAAVASLAVAGVGQGTESFDDFRPVDLIIEAKDQPGLWFFMQMATGVPLFGEMPFERAFEHGFLTDEHGDKMSKSVGNIVTPDEALERYAGDAIRLYLLLNTTPGCDLSLDWDDIRDLEDQFDGAVRTSYDGYRPLDVGPVGRNRQFRITRRRVDTAPTGKRRPNGICSARER